MVKNTLRNNLLRCLSLLFLRCSCDDNDDGDDDDDDSGRQQRASTEQYTKK